EVPSADSDRRTLINALRPFVHGLAGQTTVTGAVAALFEVMTRLAVRGTLAGWIDTAHAAGDFELASEHAQAWGDLVELFDELVELLGDEPVAATSFSE